MNRAHKSSSWVVNNMFIFSIRFQQYQVSLCPCFIRDSLTWRFSDVETTSSVRHANKLWVALNMSRRASVVNPTQHSEIHRMLTPSWSFSRYIVVFSGRVANKVSVVVVVVLADWLPLCLGYVELNIKDKRQRWDGTVDCSAALQSCY